MQMLICLRPMSAQGHSYTSHPQSPAAPGGPAARRTSHHTRPVAAAGRRRPADRSFRWSPGPELSARVWCKSESAATSVVRTRARSAGPQHARLGRTRVHSGRPAAEAGGGGNDGNDNDALPRPARAHLALLLGTLVAIPLLLAALDNNTACPRNGAGLGVSSARLEGAIAGTSAFRGLTMVRWRQRQALASAHTPASPAHDRSAPRPAGSRPDRSHGRSLGRSSPLRVERRPGWGALPGDARWRRRRALAAPIPSYTMTCKSAAMAAGGDHGGRRRHGARGRRAAGGRPMSRPQIVALHGVMRRQPPTGVASPPPASTSRCYAARSLGARVGGLQQGWGGRRGSSGCCAATAAACAAADAHARTATVPLLGWGPHTPALPACSQ